MTYRARTKYDDPGRASRYARRSARRDEEEWRLLAKVLSGLPAPPRDALDAPCGTGRVAERLLERGIPTRAADLSPPMRAEALARLAGRDRFLGVFPLDLEDAAPDPALASDLVVCFRLLHHLPDAATLDRVLRSLRALARGNVVVSFHHPVSLHNLQRGLRRLLTGRVGDRHTITVGALRRAARGAGLQLVAAWPLRRYLREFWVARLVPAG